MKYGISTIIKTVYLNRAAEGELREQSTVSTQQGDGAGLLFSVVLPLPDLQWTKPIISCCWEGGWTQKTAKPPAVRYPYLMVSDEAFRQFLFATCGSLVGSFWNSYHLGSDIFPVQFIFYFFLFRPCQKQLWLRLLAGDTKLCKLQDTASMTKYILISLKAAVLCVYCVFFLSVSRSLHLGGGRPWPPAV